MGAFGTIIHDLLVLLAGNAGGGSYEPLLAQTKQELGMPLDEHHQALLDAKNAADEPQPPSNEELIAQWRAAQAQEKAEKPKKRKGGDE